MALDRIHDLLRMLVNRDFPDGRYLDATANCAERAGGRMGRLRLTRVHGGTSCRPDRRRSPGASRAAIEDLLEVAPPERRSPLTRQLKLLEAQVDQEYDADEQVERANTADRQGIGSPE
jgi:hypothetical protein